MENEMEDIRPLSASPCAENKENGEDGSYGDEPEKNVSVSLIEGVELSQQLLVGNGFNEVLFVCRGEL